MIKTYDYKGLKWHDLENPNDAEIRQMINDHQIPTEAADDLLSPTPKQRVTHFKNCIYLVLHFPALRGSKSADHRQEIDFIIGQDFLITVHYDTLKSMERFSKKLQSEPDDESTEVSNAGVIFHKIIRHLYHSLLHDVELIRLGLNKAEVAIFKGDEKNMVVELSKIHRDILRFKNALQPHSEAILMLGQFFREFLGEQYASLVRDISAEYQRVERKMHNNKDLLDELRLTNDSLLSAKQNEAIKGLTMMAFLTFPLTLIATIFAMDTNYKPIIGMRYDFWIIILLMTGISVLSVSFFKFRKWL